MPPTGYLSVGSAEPSASSADASASGVSSASGASSTSAAGVSSASAAGSSASASASGASSGSSAGALAAALASGAAAFGLRVRLGLSSGSPSMYSTVPPAASMAAFAAAENLWART